jgi:hypothetical protein
MNMIISAQFQLLIENEWPPVGSEALQFEKTEKYYKCVSVPLFVKQLSVGDIISFTISDNGFVKSWSHISKSNNSTIWILRLDGNQSIDSCLAELRLLQCNTAGIDEFGCYAVDVPDFVQIADVDFILNSLDENLVGIAFPSMRHPE